MYTCLLCTPAFSAAKQENLIFTILSMFAGFAGFCLACRIKCHGDQLQHVVSQWTKSLFLCDCGNERMKNLCVLCFGKTPCRVLSLAYYHNFIGRYCRCNHIFDEPLPEKQPAILYASSNYMAKCALCED